MSLFFSNSIQFSKNAFSRGTYTTGLLNTPNLKATRFTVELGSDGFHRIFFDPLNKMRSSKS
ncbi:hypothetical protein K2X05_08720, partial [bacterium]|nr:hypothetical protein [bacterium]